ncbi:helix-turn-helix transcriptional regulator [Hymenobacter jejuensis]|uniref:Helix-turn-helix transcriptional regulator n=1 Tax=Hymenobacter jejuensis TaxID=2502781 RepID=A0A5B8A218_9BACT|nr:AraC family transcriptional regulator [Hymenobacter jejuensis]QDA61441.1 helix-turn-helix transcriptional regulator [Hymenobacter jejuensis]
MDSTLPYAVTYQARPAELVHLFQQELEQDFQALLRGDLPDIPEISEYADRLHVHPTHLSNTLKYETGLSPCNWVNTYFLAEAKRLLLTTTLSIAEISDKLTFGEPTNFTKYFKRHMGLTPK